LTPCESEAPGKDPSVDPLLFDEAFSAHFVHDIEYVAKLVIWLEPRTRMQMHAALFRRMKKSTFFP